VRNPEGSFVRRLQDTFQHIAGFAPVLFFGRGIFQVKREDSSEETGSRAIREEI